MGCCAAGFVGNVVVCLEPLRSAFPQRPPQPPLGCSAAERSDELIADCRAHFPKAFCCSRAEAERTVARIGLFKIMAPVRSITDAENPTERLNPDSESPDPLTPHLRLAIGGREQDCPCCATQSADWFKRAGDDPEVVGTLSEWCGPTAAEAAPRSFSHFYRWFSTL